MQPPFFQLHLLPHHSIIHSLGSFSPPSLSHTPLSLSNIAYFTCSHICSAFPPPSIPIYSLTSKRLNISLPHSPPFSSKFTYPPAKLYSVQYDDLRSLSIPLTALTKFKILFFTSTRSVTTTNSTPFCPLATLVYLCKFL